MKLLALAVLLGIAATAGTYSQVDGRRKELQAFCETLPIGQSTAEVREAARKMGFEPVSEPYAQMRVNASFWLLQLGSCRVFFNNDRTVEYRSFEKS